MTCHILVLIASPSDAIQTELQQEATMIRQAIGQTQADQTQANQQHIGQQQTDQQPVGKLHVEIKQIDSIIQISQYILKFNPRLVYLTIPSYTNGTILLMDAHRQLTALQTNDLVNLIGFMDHPPNYLFLNRCFDSTTAELLTSHIDAVLGFKPNIAETNSGHAAESEAALLTFVEAFYRSLVQSVDRGTAVFDAFEAGCDAYEQLPVAHQVTYYPHFFTQNPDVLERPFIIQPETKSQVADAVPKAIISSDAKIVEEDTESGLYRSASPTAIEEAWTEAEDDEPGLYRSASPTATERGWTEEAAASEPASVVQPPTEQPPTEQPQQMIQQPRVYQLWFGTNRQPIDRYGRPVDEHERMHSRFVYGENAAIYQQPPDIIRFSNERADRLYQGTCEVVVPESHKIGSTGSGWIQRLIRGEDDRLTLREDKIVLKSKRAFWRGVRQALSRYAIGERDAFVFIHGFNVAFETCALRAAQLEADLDIPGITAFYSWPSKGRTRGYVSDEATIQATEPFLTEFLINFAQESGAERVHILAHSMGCRGLLRSMQRILAKVNSGEIDKISFGQIFLAAPDVDVDLFRDLAHTYEKLAQRTTMYVSKKDRALIFSEILHAMDRVGHIPPITVVPHIDTIDASHMALTFLGHGYYALANSILEDMVALIQQNHPPLKRQGLWSRWASDAREQRYWVMKV